MKYVQSRPPVELPVQSRIVVLTLTGLLAVVLGAAIAVSPLAGFRVGLGIVVCGVFLFRPYWLLLTWALFAFFGDLRVEGQTVFGILTYVSLPCFFFRVMPAVPSAVRKQPWIGVWLCFLALVGLNAVRSPYGIFSALQSYSGYLDTAAVSVLATTEITSRARASRLIQAVLASAAVVAVVACVQYLIGAGGFASTGVYRVFSVFSWANTLGFALIVPIGLVAARIGSVQRKSGGVWDYFVLLLLVGGLFVSFGRGAWIGAAVAVLVPLFLSPSVSLTRRLLVTIGTLAILVTSVLRVDLSDRILEATSLPGRAYIWSLVLQHFSEFFLTGRGLLASDYLARVSADIPDAVQNIYLVVLYDFGIAGLVLFLATWIVMSVDVVRKTRRVGSGGGTSRWGALGILAGVLVYSTAGSELFNFAPSIYLWITLTTTLALANLDLAADSATANNLDPGAVVRHVSPVPVAEGREQVAFR